MLQRQGLRAQNPPTNTLVPCPRSAQRFGRPMNEIHIFAIWTRDDTRNGFNKQRVCLLYCVVAMYVPSSASPETIAAA